MAFRWARQGLVVAFLVAAAGSAAPQVRPAAPPRQGQPATPPKQVQPGTPPNGQAGGQAQQLGRPFIRQVPPPPPRKSPQVHVSVVSPRQSSNVFQHIGQQRGQSGGGRSTGGFGGTGGVGNTGGMGGMGTGGGMGSGFQAR
jgi:hypothetical protein